MENWLPVTDQNGHCMLEDGNIVVQNKITEEIGHVPATTESYNAFNILPLTSSSYSNEAPDENTANSRIEWGEETRLLLDLYHNYLPQIGPMKKFKYKKEGVGKDITRYREKYGHTENTSSMCSYITHSDIRNF
ncbi:unnamed protein product [Callosobruchus maculatus]|uniref:Uncharacterized protein n=1 Tax=Callosobruchus maculatus TaxID=64391 RepID=A0A653BEM8_CALMS|nr:unnamed protein product [Callosobruchus maculatus]